MVGCKPDVAGPLMVYDEVVVQENVSGMIISSEEAKIRPGQMCRCFFRLQRKDNSDWRSPMSLARWTRSLSESRLWSVNRKGQHSWASGPKILVLI